MCIGYAFRPHLSSRLTRSGRTFLLKPEAFGHYDSHIILATHSGILSSLQSITASAIASPRKERSPTTLYTEQPSHISFILTDNLASVAPPQRFYIYDCCSMYSIPSFGIQFSPVKSSAQGHSTSELLRTLLMNGCF